MTDRDDKIEEVASNMEKELTLVGSTAIEDQLQDDVDGTIKFMREAGIRVWVLTGDKIETAINIGFSCKLLTNEMQQYLIDGVNEMAVLDQISEHRKNQINTEGMQDSATVVAGDSLFKIMANERIKENFLQLATKSKVLIACRMSPKQKADIVTMIQEHSPEVTTLSIGDGANDVNMINAAHIGVGISGLEGQQATSASDYAIGEFKFLKTLLFYHGREDYRRNCYLVNYTFYKNIFFVMPHFFMAFYSMASGVSFYEKWLYQIFNIFFSGIPIMVYCLIDEEHPRKDLLSKPDLYKIGLKNYCFTTKLFWFKWVLYGIFQAGVLFYVSFLSFGYSPQVPGGDIGDIWVEGTFIYGAVCIIVNLKIMYDGNTHTFASMFLIWA